MVERYRSSKSNQADGDGDDYGREPIWERLLASLAEEYRYGNSACKLYADLLVEAMVNQDPVLQDCFCFHQYHELKDKKEYEAQQTAWEEMWLDAGRQEAEERQRQKLLKQQVEQGIVIRMTGRPSRRI
jgi:hypothetical protein